VKALKKIGAALNTGDDQGVIVAVAVALIIVSILIGGYYVYHVFFQQPEGYTTIYVLDGQGKVEDIPSQLIVNQETIFYVYVENHERKTLQFEVQLKVTNEPGSLFPVEIAPMNTFSNALADGEKWPIQSSVTLPQTGNHAIVFELWAQNEQGELVFTGNAVILNVEGINQP